jgi:1-acyl-sn-glycerol-3-phosphate acyltransferase
MGLVPKGVVPSPKAAARTALRKVPFPYRPAIAPHGVPVPEGKARSGAAYDTDWARRYPARIARLALMETLMRGTVELLAAPQRFGVDRLSELEGPAIFAANHHSHVDTPLMLTSIPEPWRYRMFVAAGADYFFTNPVTSALSALVIGAIPIERTKVARRSAQQAAELLSEGWSLLIFPEGGRSPDGWGQEFRGGAPYLSAKVGVPIVPVHLEGTGRILRKGAKKVTPSATTVRFGHPLHPEEGEDARGMAARLEQAVAALADEHTTDWWSAKQRAAQGATPPLAGPDAPSWRRAWAQPDKAKRERQKRRWPDLD